VIQKLTFLEKGELLNLENQPQGEIEADAYTNENCFGFLYYEVSAKTGENIEEAIQAMTKQILRYKKTKKHKSNKEKDFGTTRIYAGPNLLDVPEEKKQCCKF
jgi:hypothetical protein